jgi:hypothetical protein
MNFFPHISDHKSILENTDWKKLWMETGQLLNRIDNNVLESSDSTIPDDNEVGIASLKSNCEQKKYH